MKIVIFQQKLPHYRIEIFNEIASLPNVELTLVHTSKACQNSIKFKEIIIPYKSIGPFKVTKGLDMLIDNSDFTVLMFDLKWLYIIRFLFSRKRKKIVLWVSV